MDLPIKQCAQCRGIFPATLENFNRNNQQRNGLTCYCKKCLSKQYQALYPRIRESIRQYQIRNREVIKEREKAYWKARPQQKKANTKRFYWANLEKYRASNKARYLRNPEKCKAQLKQWLADHPEYKAKRTFQQNMKRRAVPLNSEALQYSAILRKDPCSYCGASGQKIVIDHIHPISLGGNSDWTNLTAACVSCNAKKCNKPLLKFLLEATL